MSAAQELTPVVLQHAGAGTDGDQYPQSTASTDVALLDALPREQQELAVTMMLDQAKQWLDRAMESTNPAREVSEFKAFVATVAEASKQKKLSEDIQLDATEMVRRAERALGVAIRKGQDAGEIAGRRDNPGPQRDYERNGQTIRVDQIREPKKVSPTEFFTNAQQANETYAMTDDVTDEQFEALLTEAKEEGNLSRANIVRKASAVASTWREQHEAKWAKVAELAEQRLTSAQIAKRVGMSERGMRDAAKDRGITFPADEYVRNTRRINGIDVMERTVSSLEVNQTSLELVDFDDITPEQAAEWLQRLTEPLRAINRMKTRLKEISNG